MHCISLYADLHTDNSSRLYHIILLDPAFSLSGVSHRVNSDSQRNTKGRKKKREKRKKRTILLLIEGSPQKEIRYIPRYIYTSIRLIL